LIILNLAKLPGTSKLAGNKKQGGEGLMANIIAHGVLIWLIRAGAFNAFSSPKTTIRSNYPFGNSVILDLSSTCNIRNAKSRFDLKSFWPL
jgi:hypothetical protein